MNNFKGKFEELAKQLEDETRKKVNETVDIVSGTLDIFGNENAALEAEQDPAFRRRVTSEIDRIKAAMVRVSEVIGDGRV